MMSSTRNVRALVRDARAALDEVLRRRPLVRAWELLQERDGDGNARGPLPYTAAALEALEAAHQAEPDDIGVIHHLAIATHAHAWDLELAGDASAAAEWTRALGFWRMLASSSEFWAGLELRARAFDAGTAFIEPMRRDLLENLLDIHVGFIRHYFDRKESSHALAHVELVRRASIPPAIKKRLVDKIFIIMTGTVADSRAALAYESALESIEKFLFLFTDNLPALRLYAEVFREWVAGLSFRDDWALISDLERRALEHVTALAAHPELSRDPLAETALEEAALELAMKCRDRGGSLDQANVAAREDACAAFVLGMKWARLGYPRSPRLSRLRTVFAGCANQYAIAKNIEARELQEHFVRRTLEARPITRTEAQKWKRDLLRAMGGIYAEAVEVLEEAVACHPDEPVLAKNLQLFRERTLELEVEAS